MKKLNIMMFLILFLIVGISSCKNPTDPNIVTTTQNKQSLSDTTIWTDSLYNIPNASYWYSVTFYNDSIIKGIQIHNADSIHRIVHLGLYPDTDTIQNYTALCYEIDTAYFSDSPYHIAQYRLFQYFISNNKDTVLIPDHYDYKDSAWIFNAWSKCSKIKS